MIVAGSRPASTLTRWQRPLAERAVDLLERRVRARRREIGTKSLDKRQRVDVHPRLRRRPAERRPLPGVVRPRAVPDAVPHGDRGDVDVEPRARERGRRLRVLRPEVGRDRRAVEAHGRLVPLDERARDRAGELALEVDRLRVDRRLERAREHLAGVGDLRRRRGAGERPEAERGAARDEDDQPRWTPVAASPAQTPGVGHRGVQLRGGEPGAGSESLSCRRHRLAPEGPIRSNRARPAPGGARQARASHV